MSTNDEHWARISANAKAISDLLNTPVARNVPAQVPASGNKKNLNDGVYHTLDQLNAGGSGDSGNGTSWLDTPVVKSVLNAISAPGYILQAGLAADEQAIKKGIESFQGDGNPIKAAGAYLGEGADQLINHNPGVMGLKAGFGNDASSVRMGHDNVREAQQIASDANVRNGGQPIDVNSPENKAIQGGVGLGMDIGLDPLMYIPGIGVAAGAGGAIKGGAKAIQAAREVAKGGEALGRTTKLGEGIVQGAQAGFKGFHADQAEKLLLKNQRKGFNAAIKAGESPAVISESIKGFQHLPENVQAGLGKVRGKDLSKALKTQKRIEKSIEVAATPIGTTGKVLEDMVTVTPESIGQRALDTMTQHLGGKLSDNKARNAIALLKQTARAHGINYDEALAAAGGNPLTKQVVNSAAVKAAEAAPQVVVKSANDVVDSADNAIADAAPSVGNVNTLAPAHSYVDSPGAVNLADHIVDSPADQFIKGTAHLTAPVPKYSRNVSKTIEDYLVRHPSAESKVTTPALYDHEAIAKLLAGKRGLSGKEPHNLEFRKLTRTGQVMNSNPFTRAKLLDKLYQVLRPSFAKGEDANAAASKWLTEHIAPEDLQNLVRHSKAEISPAVIERSWKGPKPTPSDLRNAGWKGKSGKDVLEARQIINQFGTHGITRDSGAFKDILEAYKNRTLSAEATTQFEQFANQFFGLTGEDAHNSELIAQLADKFIRENGPALTTSALLHAPTAESGRLLNIGPMGGKGAGKGLIRILGPKAAETYSRPLRESERLSVMTAMSQKAEADIINGVGPDFVAKTADEIFKKHFNEYSTPLADEAGMVLRTNQHFSTATGMLANGGAKKEYWWTTHSAIDLFSKTQSNVSKFIKDVPELKSLRDAAYRHGATPAAKKAYEKAYKLLQDNLSMRILAQVDTNLKAYNIFGYLTNVMKEGDVAVRLSFYDVLDAIGPELRMKNLWTRPGEMNNLRPTQFMDMAESLIRTIAGADSKAGVIDEETMLKNTRDILRGNFAKNADAKGFVRVIQENLDSSTRDFNKGIIDKNVGNFTDGARKTAEGKAFSARDKVYSDIVKHMLNNVGEDGLTGLQRLANTTLRNTALHASSFGNKIVYATEEHMNRLTQQLEQGTVGNLFEEIMGLVKFDKFEPEVSKVFKDEIQSVNSEFLTPLEQSIGVGTQRVAEINGGGRPMLQLEMLKPKPEVIPTAAKKTYKIRPAGKPVESPRFSVSSAGEIADSGKQLLKDGKPASSKWGERTNRATDFYVKRQKANTKANVAVAARSAMEELKPENIQHTIETLGEEQTINMIRQELAHDTVRRMYMGRRIFDVKFGKTLSYDVVTAGMHMGPHLETAFHGMLEEFAKKYTPEIAGQALKDLQAIPGDVHEAIRTGAVQVSQEVKDMAKMVDVIFDSSKNNWFVRNGVGPGLMNDVLKDMTNVPWRFPETVVEDGVVTLAGPEHLGQAWKAWEGISNPYRAFAAMHTAMVKVSSDVSMGARYSNHFGLPAIPKGEEANWAKIEPSAKNVFTKLIDTDLYYPKELIAELPELGHFITASRTFKNEKFQQWVNSFDEFTSALKLTQTVMKPGHHVMSVTGDYFRNSMAGVRNADYKDAWKVLRSRNAADKGFSNMDKYANMKGIADGVNVTTSGTRDGLRLTINGKDVYVPHDKVYDVFIQRGVDLPVHGGGSAEDLLATAGSHSFDNLPGGRIANAVTKGTRKINRVVSGTVNNRFIKLNDFTAQRDNLFRFGLAIRAMKGKNFKSLDDAFAAGEEFTRKWAPTAKDMTAFESKYNRRVFLYYTWLRGMIPRVVEGIIMNPGLAVAPSKAMYNIGIMNGLNPASVGDPFDSTTLIPDYYRQSVLGPQWQDPNNGHLWGLNPTAPIMDVFNTIGAGITPGGLLPQVGVESDYERVGRTLLGMTNPIFRSPVELATQTNLGTNTPIQDDGQYLTDMVGPARFASKVTGHTINPTLGGIPRRTEAKFKNGIGTPDQWWNNAALEGTNYLTGLQVKDYTSDSATKTARFNQKAPAKQQAKNDARTNWWNN